MTLTEALNSGRRFKRKGRTVWIEVLPNGLLSTDDPNFLSHLGSRRIAPQFTNYDIMANDYEVDEIYVSLSVAEFEVAWQAVFGGLRDTSNGVYKLKEFDLYKKMCNKLGLVR